MNEDEYIGKLNKIEQAIQKLTKERAAISIKLKALEEEKEELKSSYSLQAIRSRKNAEEWTTEKFKWSDEIKTVLQEKFKLKDFRQKQLAAINSTLSNKDVLLLMPTGGGKSLVYQLTALLSKGVTLVVSPLISLIDDQLRALKDIGIEAATIGSNTYKEERKFIHHSMTDEKSSLKLIYVTPEWVSKSKIFMTYLQKCYDKKLLARIVIDEVHCCSTWGHDFRPDYNHLGLLKGMFRDVPIIGLTATATMNILVDIQKMLNLEDAVIITAPFNRPNLFYKVITKPSDKDDCINWLVKWLKNTYTTQSGIIYTSTVKETEDLANELKKHDIKAKFYHGQLDADVRKSIYMRWLNNKYQIIVATVAFGMGIDKPDVRFVIHYTLPKSMENLYQESGRAGRDGKQSDCILMFNLADYLKVYSMSSSRVEETNCKALLNYCLEQSRCRRYLIAEHFEDTWRQTDCNKMCDHCSDPKTVSNFIISNAAVDVIKIIDKANQKEVKVTLLKLLGAWFQSGYKEIRPSTVKKPNCSKEVAEFIIAFLLLKNILVIEKGFNLYSTLSYLQKNRMPDEIVELVMPYKSQINFKKKVDNSHELIDPTECIDVPGPSSSRKKRLS